MANTLRTSRRRHLRHGIIDVLGSRLGRVKAWTGAIVTNLTGTESPLVYTADNTTNQLTSAGHGFTSGDGPYEIINAGGAVPAGLSTSTLYWVSVVDANIFQLHTSRLEAARGLNPLTFTDDGTGTNSIQASVSDQAMIEHLRQDVSPEVINNAADVDDLI